jgi:hypothetical protein
MNTESEVHRQEEMQWCDFEGDDFPVSEFLDTAYGKVHITGRRPLHTSSGETFGNQLPAPLRTQLQSIRQALDSHLRDA